MKSILFIVVILFASCTKSIVEAPEVIVPDKSVEINRTDLMVSPQFVKGSDNNVLVP